MRSNLVELADLLETLHEFHPDAFDCLDRREKLDLAGYFWPPRDGDDATGLVAPGRPVTEHDAVGLANRVLVELGIEPFRVTPHKHSHTS